MQNDLADVRRDLDNQGIDILRLIWPDVLGLTRSKDVMVSQLERAAGHGPAFCQATWTTTTRGDVLDGHGSLQDGLSDMVSRLDADTIRPIPWVPGVAYGIADIDEPDGAPNKPYLVRRADGTPFAFAGLWEKWIKPEGGMLETFAIVNTAAVGAMTRIHERIPVVLAPDDYAEWLAPDGDKLHLVKAPPSEWFATTAITNHVNNVRNDDERCMAPLGDEPPAPSPAKSRSRKVPDERQMKLF